MEFSSCEDIKAPVSEVFAALSDFDEVADKARRRGIEVQRLTSQGPEGEAVGMSWQARFKFRGRMRASDVRLSEFAPPERMVFDSETGGLETRCVIKLTSLSPDMTRVDVSAHLSARNMSARLLVHSMKLAKSKLSRKFAVRFAQAARDIEERIRRRA